MIDENEDALAEVRTSITNLIIIFTFPYVLSFFPFFYKLGHYYKLVLNSTLIELLIAAYYLNYLNKKSLAPKIIS